LLNNKVPKPSATKFLHNANSRKIYTDAVSVISARCGGTATIHFEIETQIRLVGDIVF